MESTSAKDDSSEIPGLVSIGVPVYNGARHLAGALDALLAQTYASTEIVISDNASEDNSLEIARSYAARYPHIRIYQNDRNLGPYPNFEIVMQKARGQFFMWAACDDRWEKDYVATMVEALAAHPDAVVAQSGFTRRTDRGEDRGTVVYEDVYTANRWSLTLKVALNLTGEYAIFIYGLFRRAFLRDAWRNFQYFRSSEWLFIAQLTLGRRMVSVPRVLHTRGVRADVKESLRIAASYRTFLVDGNDRRKSLPFAADMLWKSEVIPPQRKVLIPAMLAAFTVGQYKHDWKRLKARVTRRLGILRGMGPS